MEKHKFLERGTKTFSVFTSVLIGLAVLVLVIIGLTGGQILNVSVVGSSVLAFIVAIFLGAMQIKVFGDYKNQNKYLCADGIFYICLTILVAISALVFVFTPNAQFDLRYFIFAFTLAFAVWKIILAVLGFKNKRFNAFVELLIAVCWLISGVAVMLTATMQGETPLYLLCASNYLLALVTIFYILYSYVFREPTYLETEEGLRILQKELEAKEQRLNRFNNRYNSVAQTQTTTNEEKLEDKLAKLQNLKEKGFITEEEFEAKKKDLINKEL